MLLDMDRERTASTRLQKELDALTAASLCTADEHRRELHLLQQALGDSRQKKGQLEGALQAVTASLDRTSLEAKQMRAQLSESNAQVMLFRNQRSEEHTSELQSLMRISYAVLCLKKKKINK